MWTRLVLSVADLNIAYNMAAKSPIDGGGEPIGPGNGALLMETGDFLLLETGDKILLE